MSAGNTIYASDIKIKLEFKNEVPQFRPDSGVREIYLEMIS